MAYNQLKLGALLSYIALAINIIVGLIYTPWMINSIGREDYGLYTLSLSVISLFVFDFGIGQSVTRFVAKYLSEGNQEKANNCIGLVYKLYFYIDVIIFLILTTLYFFIPEIYKELTPSEIEKFKIIYIASAFFSVISFPFIPVNGILTANEKFIQLKLCDLIHKLIIVVAMSACLLLGYGLYALVLVNVAAGLLTIAFKLFFIRRDTSTRVNILYKDKYEFREILSFSVWVTVKSLAERMIFTISPTILGIVSGSVEIALFGIVNVLEGYVFSFAGALNGLFLSRVSKITASSDNDIMPLMLKVGRMLFLVVGFIIAGFITVGKEFIQLWLGTEYEAVYISTVLIILPSLIYVPHEIGLTAITVQNKVKYQALVYICMSVINILVGLILARLYGCLGLCISIFAAYLFKVIGTDIILAKYMNINISLFYSNVIMKASGVFFLTIVLSHLFSFIPIYGIFGFLIRGCFMSVIYIVTMWLFSLNKEEKSFFYSLLKYSRNK